MHNSFLSGGGQRWRTNDAHGLINSLLYRGFAWDEGGAPKGKARLVSGDSAILVTLAGGAIQATGDEAQRVLAGLLESDGAA